jgi:hypothetical protein
LRSLKTKGADSQEEKEKRLIALQGEFERVSEELKLLKTKNVKLSDFNAQSGQFKKEIEALNNGIAGLKKKDGENTN